MAEEKKQPVRDILRSAKEKGFLEEFPLPTNKDVTVTVKFYSTREAITGQKMAASGNNVNEELLQASMVSESCLFNGEKLTPEEILELVHGIDFMTLLGKLTGAVDSQESK